MPHCVIECPASLGDLVDLDVLLKAVHDAAEATGLFSLGDVKARLLLSEHFLVGGKKDPFVHVISHILAGRTAEQKKLLSAAVAVSICELLPNVEMISVEVRDIDRAAYSNRQSLFG
jgi:5-carboxymethyl-2-hydroxymuconate isomerase